MIIRVFFFVLFRFFLSLFLFLFIIRDHNRTPRHYFFFVDDRLKTFHEVIIFSFIFSFFVPGEQRIEDKKDAKYMNHHRAYTKIDFIYNFQLGRWSTQTFTFIWVTKDNVRLVLITKFFSTPFFCRFFLIIEQPTSR